MATLVSRATGNFTAAGSWEVVDTTSYLASEAGSTNISTTNLDSSTFTPGAITVTGIALKMSNRAGSPTGTFTVTLRNSTDSTDVASVTVNVSDLPSVGFGWVFFKFGSSQLLVAGKAYLVRVVCSNTGNQVTLYRNATSNNWSRLITTTTTGAPAAGDQLIIVGERTGAGTGSAFTITMDNTATTSFGPTVSGGPPQGIFVGQGGTLTWGTASSTAYYFKWKGIFAISAGGTVNIGTSGTPIPSDSSATLEGDVVTNLDTGIEVYNGGILNIYGPTKSNFQQELQADVSAAGTSLTLTTTTGIEVGDKLVVGATDGNYNNRRIEVSTVSSITDTTHVAVGSLSYAHGGNSTLRAWVANLTRRVKFFGQSTSLCVYMRMYVGSTSTVRYFEVYNYGSGTGNKNGINFDIANGSGTADWQGCSLHDGGSNARGFYWPSSGAYGVILKNNVLYNVDNGMLEFAGVVASGSSDAYDIEDNWSFDTNGTAFKINLPNDGTLGVFKNNRVNLVRSNTAIAINLVLSGNATLYTFVEANWTSNWIMMTNTYGWVIGQASIGINSTLALVEGVLADFRAWMVGNGTGASGLNFRLCVIGNLTVKNPLSWGTGTNSGAIEISGYNVGHAICWGLVIDTPDIQNGTTTGYTSVKYGISIGAYFGRVTIRGGSIGGTNAHTLGDIYFFGSQGLREVYTDKTILGSTPPVAISDAAGDSFVACQRFGATAGDHRFYQPYGTLKADSVIYHTASPSERMTPSSASIKLKSAPMMFSGASGGTRAVSVWVRKSVTGDGADYNGNQPRLILKRNEALGITADTVLDTAAASNGTWEELTGTVPTSGTLPDAGGFEVYVDCDSTAGWVNIDDRTAV